jgi:hypothetical protein
MDEGMKKRLKAIADVRAGYQFRGKVEPDHEGAVRVIQIKDVDEQRRICTGDLVAVKLDRPERYLVHKGDVLFLARGHRQFATAVAEPLANTIATGYFFILRLRTDRVMPAYLAWFINQSQFQEAMRPYVRGSHMSLISKADFQELTVELPPLPVQQSIVRLDQLVVQERRLLAELAERRASLIEVVSLRAAKQKQAQRKG